jgi:predicted SprT family Zn-dependent metalloprotease
MSNLEFTCNGIKVKKIYEYECCSCGKKRKTFKKPEDRMMCQLCKKKLVNENQISILDFEKELNCKKIK